MLRRNIIPAASKQSIDAVERLPSRGKCVKINNRTLWMILATWIVALPARAEKLHPPFTLVCPYKSSTQTNLEFEGDAIKKFLAHISLGETCTIDVPPNTLLGLFCVNKSAHQDIFRVRIENGREVQRWMAGAENLVAYPQAAGIRNKSDQIQISADKNGIKFMIVYSGNRDWDRGFFIPASTSKVSCSIFPFTWELAPTVGGIGGIGP